MLPLSASRLLLVALLCAVALGFLGCGSSSSTTAPSVLPSAFPNHSPDEIRSYIETPTDTLQRFSARARVTVRSPQENRSFNADIRQQRADSLFMRFSVFGFEGGRMLLTPDSAYIYDSRAHKLQVGGLKEAIQRLPAPLSPGEIFPNLLGIVAPDPDIKWTVTADSTHYHLTNASETRTWTVDARRWRATHFERKTLDGRVIEERRFSNFHSVEGVTLPRTVVFRRPPDNLKAVLEYRTLDLNPTGLSFALGVPSDVPRSPIR